MLAYMFLNKNKLELVKYYVARYCNNNRFSVMSVVTCIDHKTKEVRVILISQFIENLITL